MSLVLWFIRWARHVRRRLEMWNLSSLGRSLTRGNEVRPRKDLVPLMRPPSIWPVVLLSGTVVLFVVWSVVGIEGHAPIDNARVVVNGGLYVASVLIAHICWQSVTEGSGSSGVALAAISPLHLLWVATPSSASTTASITTIAVSLGLLAVRDGFQPVLDEPNDDRMEAARPGPKLTRSRSVPSRLIGAAGVVGGLLIVAAAVRIGVGEISKEYSFQTASGKPTLTGPAGWAGSGSYRLVFDGAAEQLGASNFVTARRLQLAHDLGAMWWGVVFLGVGLQLPLMVICRRRAALFAVAATALAVSVIGANDIVLLCFGLLAATIAGMSLDQMINAGRAAAAVTKRDQLVGAPPDGRVGEPDG